MDKVGEVVESRDDRTRTFRTADGKFRTEFSDGPVNYRDGAGNCSTAVWGAQPSYAYRTLYQSDVNFASFFTDPVDITYAELQLWATTTTSGAAEPVAAHELTTAWTDTQATWNQRQTGVAWTAPGGDYTAQPESVNPTIKGAPGYRLWPITSLMRSWVVDGRPQNGLMLKYQNETAGTHFTFPRLGTTANPHRLAVVWEPLQGLRDPYRYESFGPRGATLGVGQRRQRALSLRERDLQISGTGLGATIDRTYDSRNDSNLGGTGLRWFMWPGSFERLRFYPTGVQWLGGPDLYLDFPKKPDGSFGPPPGYRGTLTQVTGGNYELRLHESDSLYRFNTGGYPVDISDRNGNTITFGYVFNAGMNQ